MPYRLHSPSIEAGTVVPLIIYLHGSGGWGTDNVKQISGGNTHGTRLWLKSEIASENPAYVLAPQIPRPQLWGAPDSEELAPYAEVLVELINQIKSELLIDENRIYIMGQSLGGIGVWDIIAKRPDIFAAGVPVCGAGNPDRIVNARNIALWAFHGAMDTTVPVAGSRNMVTSLEAAKGNIRYTEYPDVGHNSWERAFADPGLSQWLFSNVRGQSQK
ncbi:MAG: prolyl oligopeptidase family serine peptidase [Gammaproteobacteria bacterium]|nr:prolyl oligopeptidase family serine peptidase [Gammaproteobacteria bacterium]